MNEALAGYRFIHARLLGDAELVASIGNRIYPTLAPAGTDYPLILISYVSGIDLMVIGGERIWTNILWQVEVWSRTADLAVVAQRTARVDAVLHRAKGTVSGAAYASGTIWECVREQALLLPPERDGDIVYSRGGGEYRQFVSMAAA